MGFLEPSVGFLEPTIRFPLKQLNDLHWSKNGIYIEPTIYKISIKMIEICLNWKKQRQAFLTNMWWEIEFNIFRCPSNYGRVFHTNSKTAIGVFWDIFQMVDPIYPILRILSWFYCADSSPIAVKGTTIIRLKFVSNQWFQHTLN